MNSSETLTLEKFESTIADVLEIMSAGFESVDVRLDSLFTETREIKSRVVHLEDSMVEVQYSLAALTKAEEKDAEATINHEIRIQNLEKINKIKTIPAEHLANIQA